jgi:glycosyltransferase involved in cell wall biosynthesis
MSWYAHAARLQTVSRPIAEAILQQAPATAAKVRVVPYPLGAECFAPADTVANRLAGSGLLYVGRVHPEKGMDVLLSAFRTLAQSSHGAGGLTVVGPWQKELGGGGTAYYERLRQQAQSQAEKVRWIGPVFEPARLAAYYDQAALFVYPSLAEKGETFGLAPLEAMARGCPPLVSNLACFQDFIRPEETGFVFDHRRPDADRVLGDKIQSLLAAPERLRETGRRAFAKAQEYALPLVATRYLEDFAALLDVQN